LYNAIYDSLIIAKKVIYLPSCHSTNDIAAELVRNDMFEEGTVVITNEQTKGRGQRGTSWFSQPNQNLTFSVILRPDFIPISEQFSISKAIAVGICSYLQSYTNDVKIKWPNDVYLGNKKICGVLIENAIQATRTSSSIVGIGVNINQLDFPGQRTTSLALHGGAGLILTDEFRKLALHLDASYLKLKSTSGRESINASYLGFLYDYQVLRKFRIDEKVVEGAIKGINENGQLCILIKGNTEPVAFNTKEVEWVWED
jgi:BirA family transcriptional regulator, biotin operon repressor / biotin---[acetyl-CoA-carboxylase] ligase